LLFNQSLTFFRKQPMKWVRGLHLFFLAVSLILWVIQLIMDIGFHKIFLLLHDGQDARVEDLFLHYKLFWKYLGTSILLALAIMVGLVLLIVPGVYWGLKYSFALLLVVDKEMSPLEAFRESAKITEGIKWKLLGLVVLIALINILGVIAFGVGLLVTIPLTAFAFVFVYRRLSHETAGEIVPTNNDSKDILEDQKESQE